MSIAPFAPVNLIGGQSSNKIIYNMHGILMNIVIVHLDYYTSHLQHGSHQTYWLSLLIWIQVLIAFDLSHPTLLEVTPPNGTAHKSHPTQKRKSPYGNTHHWYSALQTLFFSRKILIENLRAIFVPMQAPLVIVGRISSHAGYWRKHGTQSVFAHSC